MQTTTTPLSRATNLAMLLLALDADGNPNNGIDVSAHAGALANAQLDFDVRLFEFPEKLSRLAPDLNRNIPSAAPVKWLYRSLGIADGRQHAPRDRSTTTTATGSSRRICRLRWMRKARSRKPRWILPRMASPTSSFPITLDSLGRDYASTRARRSVSERHIPARAHHRIDLRFARQRGAARGPGRRRRGRQRGFGEHQRINLRPFGRILSSTYTSDFDFDGGARFHRAPRVHSRCAWQSPRGAHRSGSRCRWWYQWALTSRPIPTMPATTGSRRCTCAISMATATRKPESRRRSPTTRRAARPPPARITTSTRTVSSNKAVDRPIPMMRRAIWCESVSRNDSDFFGGFFTYEVTTESSYNRDRRRINVHSEL